MACVRLVGFVVGFALLLSESALAQAPTELRATVSPGGGVGFSWQGVGSSWLLEAGSAPGLADLATRSFTSPTRVFAVLNVPAGTYYVRIRAIMNGVPSAPSNEVTVVVGCSTPGELDSRATVSGVQVQFDWLQYGTAAGVLLEAGTAPGLSNVAVLRLPHIPARFTAAGVPGTYYVRIRVLGTCDNPGAASNEVRVDLGSTANCVPTLSPFNRNVTVSGVYTVTITVPSGCAWNVFTRDPGWITPLTLQGVGSGTIQVPRDGARRRNRSAVHHDVQRPVLCKRDVLTQPQRCYRSSPVLKLMTVNELRGAHPPRRPRSGSKVVRA